MLCTAAHCITAWHSETIGAALRGIAWAQMATGGAAVRPSACPYVATLCACRQHLHTASCHAQAPAIARATRGDGRSAAGARRRVCRVGRLAVRRPTGLRRAPGRRPLSRRTTDGTHRRRAQTRDRRRALDGVTPFASLATLADVYIEQWQCEHTEIATAQNCNARPI